MANLPDFEGLAIFAKVVEVRSFAGAAAELNISKATVSKAVSRIEARLGARLINRTSRQLALTDAGRQLVGRAANILAEGEAAEDAALAQAAVPRGLLRLAAPMSFGVLHIAPLLPEFLATYPEVSVDLHLSDAMVDLIGEAFDAAIRIAILPNSSLVARRLCGMQPYLVGAPAYLNKHGRPRNPADLAEHRCIGYSYTMTPKLGASPRTANPRQCGHRVRCASITVTRCCQPCLPGPASAFSQNSFCATRSLLAGWND